MFQKKTVKTINYWQHFIVLMISHFLEKSRGLRYQSTFGSVVDQKRTNYLLIAHFIQAPSSQPGRLSLIEGCFMILHFTTAFYCLLTHRLLQHISQGPLFPAHTLSMTFLWSPVAENRCLRLRGQLITDRL